MVGFYEIVLIAKPVVDSFHIIGGKKSPDL